VLKNTNGILVGHILSLRQSQSELFQRSQGPLK
jgi:hypothetical protein